MKIESIKVGDYEFEVVDSNMIDTRDGLKADIEYLCPFSKSKELLLSGYMMDNDIIVSVKTNNEIIDIISDATNFHCGSKITTRAYIESDML